MNISPLKKLGLIVNPIAGMGGSVGLKGTDGQETLTQALALGAKPVAPQRVQEFLQGLKTLEHSVEVFTYPREMGGYSTQKFGFKVTVLHSAVKVTTSEETCKAALQLLRLKVDLLAFCGGDGTARDVYHAVNAKIPVVGIPAGVKMYSAVFAVTPRAASQVAVKYLQENLPLIEAEVMDIDEIEFRHGRLSGRVYGYMLTPCEPMLIQHIKTATPCTEFENVNRQGIAKQVVETMEPDTLYILGPGTTVHAVAEYLGVKKSLLGVDLVKNRRLIGFDVNEEKIVSALKGAGGKVKVIVTPLGGMGFIFGRGNQQISPRVLKAVGRENILLISTISKLRGLDNLKVDTGDIEVDGWLKGYVRVIVDYNQEQMVKVI